MAPRKNLQKQAAQELAARLQQWAGNFGHSQDPYVVALFEALQAGQDLSYWASIEPLEYLPNFDFHLSSKSLKLSRFLAGFRNIIIFVPVALTWAAVSMATTAFNTFVQQNAGTPANFLQFWQDGYGILDRFWSIGEVARLDFIIVGLVIILTAFVAGLQSRGQAEATKMAWAFAQQRRQLALDIKKVLFEYRGGGSGGVTVVAGDVPAAKMRATQAALKGVNRELATVFKRLGK